MRNVENWSPAGDVWSLISADEANCLSEKN